MGIRKFDVMDLGKTSLIKPEQLGYKDSLEIIKDESFKIQKSFVKIGWYLKHIRDNKLYSEGGYANIWECAADQLGYSQPTASRFINICEKFSKDHNSPELDDKYAGFDKSQMIEMLPMEQEQLDRVSPDMTVKQIRDIKLENKNSGKKADYETDDNIPGQTSIETDFPEYMPEEDLKEDMMDVYATSHKEENSATSEKNSNESKRKPDLRGLTDSPYCKSCGTPLREYEERCSACGQLQDWEGYGQDIDPDVEEIIEGDYREIEVSDPEEENIAASRPELPVFKNNDQRKEWLANYKSWGLWYRDENIDVNYYKFDFIDGSRLVVAEYPQRLTYYSSEYRDEHYYHLLEKNKQGYKKPYDEQYRQQTDSETYLVEFLKNLQKKE